MHKIISHLKVAFLLGSLFCSCSGNKRETKVKLSDKEKSVFIDDLSQIYFTALDSCSFYLKKMDTSRTLADNKIAFLKSREWYKKAEPFIIAFDYQNYKTLNGPNLLKIEEEAPNDIRIQKPASFQVIEEALLGDEPDTKSLHRTLTFMNARLPFIKVNNMISRQSDRHFLKMIRDQIITIATKGITGFDSPVLLNSLKEASYNYQSILEILIVYKQAFADSNLYNEWINELKSTLTILEENNFDDFNRYDFIKNHINKQLNLVNETAKDWQIELKARYHLNPKSVNLFGQDFFNLAGFSSKGVYKNSDSIITLGKRIFNDKSLSKDNLMSCASCHVSDKAFTDGLKVPNSNSGKPLLRNTPTLMYTAYQKAFFYDGIAFTLEGQIKHVVENTQEFHTDLFTIEKNIASDSSYVKVFNKLYSNGVTNQNITNAIANYERSLGSFNSKFDLNMRGEASDLNDEETLGFNLFMGKAACATCHFPPTFNGTVPPKFDETELENLGMTKTSDFNNPELDDDLGRYNLYNIEERKGFFKTSTVRNIELTAPYMHNGALETLEQVLDFYNKGGGQGMGLDVPHQTLPPDALDLKAHEIKAIIAFMKTLTDQSY
ncbi:cytochrome-c peroxidase [Seonamhaeicola marinus]|uniref:Methylamine utilization protein n=1 Tax=Seonamhaeicola marinus TaxID=1912246 RepID=A0A5D0HKP7_9FLAO|nr:cytochrome c peroxidase [Seonamhaeicola marinus]TYA71540.1 methylamine utilization protein [Seonamhaeicola marinus]